MADTVVNNAFSTSTNPNPATEAPKAKPATPPKGIPFPTNKKTARELDLRQIEGIVAKHLGYRILEGKTLEEAMAAGLIKARELMNEMTRQDAKKSGPYREAANFLTVWCEQAGISQIRDCKLSNHGRLVDLEPFKISVSRIAGLIRDITDVKTAIQFANQAADIRGGRDGKFLLDKADHKALIEQLVS